MIIELTPEDIVAQLNVALVAAGERDYVYFLHSHGAPQESAHLCYQTEESIVGEIELCDDTSVRHLKTFTLDQLMGRVSNTIIKALDVQIEIAFNGS